MKRAALGELPPQFDLIIVGGGITGAGILREAVQTGAKVLLVEQHDFASGTSSRSSKLVHGGLRYLKTGQWRLTRESVQERQRLLREAPGLIEPQKFLLPLYRGRKPGPASIRFGLWLYDRMAGARQSEWLQPADVLALQPQVRGTGLLGGMSYDDAQTDDARLVLRLIFESVSEGAAAMNYVRVAEALSAGGRCAGVVLEDTVTGLRREIRARMLVNATGAWADRLPGCGGARPPALRPLRGSHLLFPLTKLPVTRAISWMHPADGRPVFVYPWQGAALYGTTDIDHGPAALDQPGVSAAETKYLIDGLRFPFPELQLQLRDAVAAYAGVRPVVASGKANPSAESREFALWSAPGLVGVTGGKLTTFRVTARQVLREAARQVAELAPRAEARVFAQSTADRLGGRLGPAAAEFRRDISPDDLQPIAPTPYCWGELRWAARHEAVLHLDDLLLRRTRLGLLLGVQAESLFARLEPLCRQELGWDGARWQQECARYRDIHRREHGVPA